MKKIFDKRKLAWFSFWVLAIIYGFTVIGKSVNVPYSDDFHQQLHTVIELEKGGDVSDAIFRQHNVHRLLTTHAFTYLEYAFTGEVNLNNQLLVAVFFLILLAIVVGRFSEREHRPIVMLIVGMTMLSLEQNAAWVGGTTQYYCLMLFSLLAVKWLFHLEKPVYLVGSLICVFLSVYSMIGGILLPFVGLAYFILSKKLGKPSSWIWLVVSSLIVVWYFQGFVRNISQPSILYFLSEPGFTFEFSLRLLTSFLSDLLAKDLLMVLGLIALVTFFYLIMRKASLKEFLCTPEGLAIFMISLLMGSVIAGRVGFEEQFNAYSGRYFIYTKTFWVIAVIALLNRQLVSKQALAFILGMNAFYMMATYDEEKWGLKVYERHQSDAMIDFMVRGTAQRFIFTSNPEDAAGFTRNAIDLGVYQPGLKASRSRQLKSFKYTDYKDGLKAFVTQDKDIGKYRYLSFTVENASERPRVAIVPRNASGPAYLIKRPTVMSQSRMADYESEAPADTNKIFEVTIDRTHFDESLSFYRTGVCKIRC